MSDEIRRRLDRLTPAQRKLLEQRLGKQRRAEAAGAELLPIDPADGPFPLSYAQERFWFLEQLEPGNPAHHLPGIALFKGPMEFAAFQRAVDLLVQRHEILRSVYEEHDGVPMQVVLPEISSDLDLVDLRGLPPYERESERVRIEERTMLAPFNLERGPVMRMRLLRLADDEHQLVSCLHHIAADGMTMQLLGEEAARAYPVFLAGDDPAAKFPPLPIQYKDYAVWQRAHLAGKRLEQGVRWWEDNLRGLAQIELPTDRPRRDDWNALGRREGLDLSPALGTRLRELARAEGTTLFVVLLSAFQALLHRWTGESDIGVGTTAANRGRAEIERLVGFFVNTLVLRTDLGGDPSFRELLKRVSATSLAAQDKQEVPFERVVDACEPERRLDRNPLFQAMFNYVEFQGWVEPLGEGLEMEYRLAQAGTLFDLTLYATVHGDEIRLDLEYDTSLFEAATVRRFLAHLETFLFTAADSVSPGSPFSSDSPLSIGDMSILPPEERLALLAWSAGPPAPQRGSLLLHERFAERAAAHPDRVAVRDDERALTYAEVDAAANRLARDLVKRGVGHGDRVAIALERGAAIIPTLLGIARSGAAWVPIDPKLPVARRELILADSGAEVVLDRLDLDAGGDPGAPDGRVEPEDCAYLIYTSGSTGVPKGVRIPHRAVVTFLDTMAVEPGLREGRRAPRGHDAFVRHLDARAPRSALGWWDGSNRLGRGCG